LVGTSTITTQYILMATLQNQVAPGDDALVTATVARLCIASLKNDIVEIPHATSAA